MTDCVFLSESHAKPNATLAPQFAEIKIPEYTIQSLQSPAVNTLPLQATVLRSACNSCHDESVTVNQMTRFAIQGIDGIAVASQLLGGEDPVVGVCREGCRRSCGLETPQTAELNLDLTSGAVLLKAASVACRVGDDAAIRGVRAAEMLCGLSGISGPTPLVTSIEVEELPWMVDYPRGYFGSDLARVVKEIDSAGPNGPLN
ncbi:hypothetical protein B0H14DRAFT_3453226 [Mycena olivaceomarginata]|nr:hypothetical protein B0H14DRAFT_3453226 [Mycena olivaceomarginata]